MKTIKSLSCIPMRLISIIAIVFLAFGCAKTPKIPENTPKLSGDTSLPSSDKELEKIAILDKGNYKYNLEDFTKAPVLSDLKISPDGRYSSYRRRDDSGKNNLYIKDLKSEDETLVVMEQPNLHLRDYLWLNNDRLLYFQDKAGDENIHIYSVGLDGKDPIDLTPFDGVLAQFVKPLEEDGYIIALMNKNNPQILEPYKINAMTGEIEQLYKNEDVKNPIQDYVFDKQGVLRAFIRQNEKNELIVYYRKNKSSKFKIVEKITWRDTFDIQGFDYTTKNPNDILVLSNLGSDKVQLVRYDLNKARALKRLYANPTFDITDVEVSGKERGYEIDYYIYNGEKLTLVPVSKYFKKLYKSFKKKFGDKQVLITAGTQKEDKYFLSVSSDRSPVSYYLYDVSTNSFPIHLEMFPHLDEKDMAKVRPIKFTARDGLVIYGYLTIPKVAKNAKRVPLIVNPHGGPYGHRDEYRFNVETQLFASRGYATLQVNYRGSGGYGKKFYLAGSKQIGRKMLDDLEDGLSYVKTLGIIDEDKVAIYGASYGGLATLGSIMRESNSYVAAVDYVGVANLFTFYNSFPPYWKPLLLTVYEQWYDIRDPKEKKIMQAVSPALNIEKLNTPLFVVQGGADPRVNINESDQIVRSLRQRGFEVPYLVRYNEGHGFGKEKNRTFLYRVMLGFFAKYLK